MKPTIEPRVDRLAEPVLALIEEWLFAADDASANLQAAFAEIDATLNSIEDGGYWPSQRDALVALKLASMLTTPTPGWDSPTYSERLAALIKVGYNRLEIMGL